MQKSEQIDGLFAYFVVLENKSMNRNLSMNSCLSLNFSLHCFHHLASSMKFRTKYSTTLWHDKEGKSVGSHFSYVTFSWLHYFHHSYWRPPAISLLSHYCNSQSMSVSWWPRYGWNSENFSSTSPDDVDDDDASSADRRRKSRGDIKFAGTNQKPISLLAGQVSLLLLLRLLWFLMKILKSIDE